MPKGRLRKLLPAKQADTADTTQPVQEVGTATLEPLDQAPAGEPEIQETDSLEFDPGQASDRIEAEEVTLNMSNEEAVIALSALESKLEGMESDADEPKDRYERPCRRNYIRKLTGIIKSLQTVVD